MSEFTSKVFMIRPAHFGRNSETLETNSFQSKITYNTEVEIAEKAILEFDAAVVKLQRAGIEVRVFQDSEAPIKPDAVFPNNWISTHASGEIILYPMLTPNRKAEVRMDVVEELGSSKMYDFRTKPDLVLEGTGSVIIDHRAGMIYYGKSDRTNSVLVEKLAALLGFQTCGFTAVDHLNHPIYHTNVMMFVMHGFVGIGLESISSTAEREAVKETILNTGKKILELTYYQITQFAGNMLQLRNDKGGFVLVCSATAWKSLEKEQKELIKQQTEVVTLDIPTIELYGGGSARCMIAENYI